VMAVLRLRCKLPEDSLEVCDIRVECTRILLVTHTLDDLTNGALHFLQRLLFGSGFGICLGFDKLLKLGNKYFETLRR